MGRVPHLLRHDGLVLARITCPLVRNLSKIDAVVNNLVDDALVQEFAALVANVVGLENTGDIIADFAQALS